MEQSKESKIKSKNKICRSYRMDSCANKNKMDKINAVMFEYRITAKKIANLQWDLFYRYGGFNKDEKISDSIKSKLSERYKQTCQYQVVGMLDSHLENLTKDFVKVVRKSSIYESTKIQLFYINRYNKWFSREPIKIPKFVEGKRVKDEFVVIEKSVQRLAIKILRGLIGGRRKPRYNNINMVLDAKVVTIESKVEGEMKVRNKVKEPASEFDYWLKLSTLEAGKPIFIPIQTNSYYEDIEGKRCNSVQVNSDYDTGDISFRFIKEIPKVEYKPIIDSIAVDAGLTTFLATDFGDLFGQQMLDYLKEKDALLQAMQKSNQKHNREVNSDRYKRIVQDIREYIKNEVCRIINRIIEIYKPKEIVTEELDFRFTNNLSKQLRRIIRNFGMRVLKNKLASIEEIYGIKITKVNPAYTSKTCDLCGYVDSRNRKGKKFLCLMCGHEIDADVGGARSIRGRSSVENSYKYYSVAKVLQVTVENYLSKLERKGKRLSSQATSTLMSNPYFKKYIDRIKVIGHRLDLKAIHVTG